MTYRLLSTAIDILRLFLREKVVSEEITYQTSPPKPEDVKKIGLGTNEIIELISPDRSHVIAAIHLLIKEKFLRQRKKWKQGVSKKLRPTPLGFEILKMIQDIASFDKSKENLFPAIRIWQDKFEKETSDVLMKVGKKPFYLSDDDYQRLTGYSKEEFEKLRNFHNRLNNVRSMLNSFLLTIMISKFVDISKRYELSRSGIELVQKIVIDQIDIFLAQILFRTGVKDEYFDPDLNSTWRQIVYTHLGSQILSDIKDFYTVSDVTVDTELRVKLRKAFWSAINLLNPPPVLLDYQVALRKLSNSAIQDLDSIMINSKKYLEQYKKYLEAFQ